MEVMSRGNRGIQLAVLSAVLFGAGTPIAKLLLGTVSPWLLAGLLYCGSGAGLWLIRLFRRAPRVRLSRSELWPFAGAILSGGVVGPVLMMFGLANMPASGASLLLNAEALFTALLAWFVFGENVDRRVAAGMFSILAGAAVLSVPSGAALGSVWPSLAILGACLAWALDNNLTRKVAETDATWLAAVKGSVAGPVNLVVAFGLGAALPAAGSVTGALVVGFFAYGISLVGFIVSMRHLGTARAGAYFSIAPFFGAILAVGLGDRPTWPLGVAAVLMALGVWLHLTERHQHEHTHRSVTHEHVHVHDEHHRHVHEQQVPQDVRHSHPHTHTELTHTHRHYPDTEHRHEH